MNILTKTKATSKAPTRPFKGSVSCDQCPEHASAAGTLGKSPNSRPLSNNRGERWRLRDVLHEVSSINRVRNCGKYGVKGYVGLKADENGQRPGFSGLSVCGSVWSCPVCSARISHFRKEELDELIKVAVGKGLNVSLLTLTQRHSKNQTLKELWDSLAYGWGSVASGRKWQTFKEQLGLVGYVKATEVTHSNKNGWHVHIHVLIVSEKSPEVTPIFFQRGQGRRKTPYPIEVYTPAEFIAKRWANALKKRGIGFIANRGGLDWQTATGEDGAKAAAHYIAKMQGTTQINEGISKEATLGAFKKARGKNSRTPFQILDDFSKNGDMDDLALWHVFEKYSKGRRALIWSNGLRDFAGLGEEKTDEELAEQEVGDMTICVFNNQQWGQVRSVGACKLLDLVERCGVESAFGWLDRHKIGYERVWGVESE